MEPKTLAVAGIILFILSIVAEGIYQHGVTDGKRRHCETVYPTGNDWRM